MASMIAGSITDTMMAYTATGRTRRHYLRKREKSTAEIADIDKQIKEALPESMGPSALASKAKPRPKPKNQANTVPGILVSIVLVCLMAAIVYWLDPEVKELIPARQKVLKGVYNFVVGKVPEPVVEVVAPRKTNIGSRLHQLSADVRVQSSSGRHDRSNIRWTAFQKGELATVELFLSSQSVDSGQCAMLFADVAEFFPASLVQVRYSYIGGGQHRDQSANCLRSLDECEGNMKGLCMQNYFKSVHPIRVLACQAKEMHNIPHNMEECMREVGANEKEITAVQNCMDMREGQTLFDLSSAYSKLVMPKQPQRMKGCTARVLTGDGKEKSVCTRDRGVMDTDCGMKLTPAAWKLHVCMVLRLQAKRMAYSHTTQDVNEVCGLPGEEEAIFGDVRIRPKHE